MNRRIFFPISVLSVTLFGCVEGGTPYYSDDAAAPSVGSVDVASELGNTGGTEVVITGSNFGNDLGVVVYFGSLNAEILSVTDTEITVLSPRGPIQGGDVTVRVGTVGGQDEVEGLYTYDMGALSHPNEVGYVVAMNYWTSCYGGLEDHGVGCSDIVWNGFSGITGNSEFFDFSFSRVHSQTAGFYGGVDVSIDDWTLETPGQVTFPYIGFAIEDLRQTVSDGANADGGFDFQLTNDVWRDDDNFCANVDNQLSWHSPGFDGRETFLYTSDKTVLDSDDDCGEEGSRGIEYHVGTLRYCETDEYQEAHTYEYEADWPVPESFFAGGRGASGVFKESEVALTIADAGIHDVALALPAPIEVHVTKGIGAVADNDTLWSIGSFEGCFDEDGDGLTDLDETALVFEWEAADAGNLTLNDDVLAANSFVRFTLTYMSFSWLGPDAYPVRASITVPDDYNVDEESGLSVMEMPVELFYEFPSADIDWSSSSDFGDTVTYTFGDPTKAGWGYVVLEVTRTTEYEVAAPDFEGDVLLDDPSKPPVVVFAYVTGDFGIYDWTPPPIAGECGNCVDDDGDGWADDEDPDCQDFPDGGEVNTEYCQDENGDSVACECSDGVDNDNDGLVDGQDEDCESAVDDLENPGECFDGVDNDGDGYTDGDDVHCEGADDQTEEAGNFSVDYDCSNGVDDDGDGWVDAEDALDCETGFDEEQLSSWICANGEDDDLDGLIDAEDPYCAINGQKTQTEARDDYSGECVDEVDNDGDLLIDGADPDCEVFPYDIEG
jgi:hypothetical protein